MGSKNFFWLKAAALISAALLLFSCATSDPYVEVDKIVDEENFQKSAEILEAKSKTVYRDKDRVLYCLDKGMLFHYAGNYAESSQLLEEGERTIEANFAVSVSQEIGTFILNDTAREYDGEDYENIYLNAFNALNYYHRGEIDEALVEIRRMNNKLRNLQVKYGVLMTNMQKLALEKKVDVPQNPSVPGKFSNSALARYLGMLFYRSAGLWDDVRIDYEQLKLAMADAPAVYPFPVPASVEEELSIPQGKARLNIIGFTGKTPIKKEETIRVPVSNSRWIKIALPYINPRPSLVSSVEVILDSGQRFSLELLEDLDAVVKETFAVKRGVIYVKSVIRASVKGAGSAVLDAMADDSSDSGNKALFSILSIGTQIFAEASEKADLRIARYFPGRAYVGGVNLDPGTYSFTINYYSGNKHLVTSKRFENVNVGSNALNLTEDVCLR